MMYHALVVCEWLRNMHKRFHGLFLSPHIGHTNHIFIDKEFKEIINQKIPYINKASMNLAICSCKSSSNTRVPLYDKGRYVEASSKRSAANITGRRRLLLFSTPMIILAAATTEASDSRTALLQKYLKKSDENKEKNDKERLDAYYKRNYKDYFGFVEGTLRAKNEQQLSESEKSILEWLDKNK